MQILCTWDFTVIFLVILSLCQARSSFAKSARHYIKKEDATVESSYTYETGIHAHKDFRKVDVMPKLKEITIDMLSRSCQ